MKEVEFIRLEQNNMTVSQYEAKFAELSRFAPHLVENEERMTRMFLRGLKLEIRQYLISHKLCLYSDVVNRTQLLDAIMSQHNQKATTNNTIIIIPVATVIGTMITIVGEIIMS